MSVRRLAKLLSEHDGSQTWDSWKRTLNRYLDDDAEKPTVPSPETARLLSEILGEPADYFVRPQARTTERDRLLARIVELEEEVRRLRAGQGSVQSE